MEFTLQSVEGVPEGSLLSIKIGETKRQGLASKVGQPFRFASSPAEPLPMKVEILTQAAPAQILAVDPSRTNIVVDFEGKMKVTLAQRQAPELQRSPTDVKVAASQGISADKMQTAQSAAVYLEQHDLVRMFQDILHGLLVSKPADPIAYLEEHVARAKGLYVKSVTKAKDIPNISGVWSIAGEGCSFLYSFMVYENGEVSGQARPTDVATWTTTLTGLLKDDQLTWTEFEIMSGDQLGEFAVTLSPCGQALSGAGVAVGGGNLRFEGTKGNGEPEAKSKKGKQRGSITSRSKVDALLEILHRTSKNLDFIMPMLPKELREMLGSEMLMEECQSQFKQLAGDRSKLGADELLPIILHLSALSPQKASSVSEEHMKKFIQVFDANEDGHISHTEFTRLVQFVMVAAHMETPEGRQLLEQGQFEDNRFKEFLDIMETDRNRINDIVPFLPDWVVEHLTSDDFMDACHDHFDRLDVDRSGTLEPLELLPVVVSLTKIDPAMVDNEKLMRFVRIFDVQSNGVIMREQFIDFAQFMAVIDFLDTTVEGQQVAEASLDYADINQLKKRIVTLKEDWTCLPSVYPVLPKGILADISSEKFATQCNDGFKALDVGSEGVIEASKLLMLFDKLCAEHPIPPLDDALYHDIYICFDKEGTGVVRSDAVVDLARYVVVLAYFTSCAEWHDKSIKNSTQRIEDLLTFLKSHCEKLDKILPYLPQEFSEDLMSYDFEQNCMVDFENLDKDRTGALEPKELIPVIIQLSQGQQLALTYEHVLEFVDLFDTKGNGVITPSEFVNFARFMMVMSYLETTDGQLIQDAVDREASVAKVEELLAMLEKDRNAIHKIIPLLPPEVYDDVTSDAFIMDCQNRFAVLDKDNSGSLEPEELFPVIVELSNAAPYAVDYSHCKKFTGIFDMHGDGVIRKDEFVDFARFLCIMSYLYSSDGKRKMGEGLAIMESSKQIDELLETLQRNRRDLRKVIPYLPDHLRRELQSEEFTANCLAKFKELDKDGNGSLDPLELYPIIIDMTSAQPYALDLDQCQRFTDIFDDERKGVISTNDFVNFARFLMVLSYLQTEDGKKTMALATADEQAIQDERENLDTDIVLTGSPLARGESRAEAHHMAVDLDYYQGKAEKLTTENDTLRSQMFRMEETIRRMENRLEEQDQRLRHAELDLRASGKHIR